MKGLEAWDWPQTWYTGPSKMSFSILPKSHDHWGSRWALSSLYSTIWWGMDAHECPLIMLPRYWKLLNLGAYFMAAMAYQLFSIQSHDWGYCNYKLWYTNTRACSNLCVRHDTRYSEEFLQCVFFHWILLHLVFVFRCKNLLYVSVQNILKKCSKLSWCMHR